MYYKKKNTNKKLIAIIALIVLLFIFSLIIIIVKVIGNTRKVEQQNVNETELIVPEIKVTNLNEQDKDVPSVVLKIEAKTEDKDGIDYIINENNNEKYTENPKELEVDKNGVYSFKVVAKNTKTKSAKIEVTQIKEASAMDPYIPEGFTHKEETTVEDGFVIVDKNGNEYVWIPVESGKLPALVGRESSEYKDEEAGVFNNSVSKNYGFYVARYEAGIDTDMSRYQIPVSKPDADVWTQLTHPQAKKMALNVAEGNGYSKTTYTSLVTGGAWRAILNWAGKEKEGYAKSINNGSYWNGIQKAGLGNDIVKNIYNLAGNLKEWTDEVYLIDTRTEEDKRAGKLELRNRILRGGSGNMAPFSPEFRTYAASQSKDDYWGFRVILYVDKPNINAKVQDEKDNKENEEKQNESKDNKENKIEIKNENENKEENKESKNEELSFD